MKQPIATVALENPDAVAAIAARLDTPVELPPIEFSIFKNFIQNLSSATPAVLVVEPSLIRAFAGELVGFVRAAFPESLVVAHRATAAHEDVSILGEWFFFCSGGNSSDRRVEVINARFERRTECRAS